MVTSTNIVILTFLHTIINVTKCNFKGISMKIINYEIGTLDISYTVETIKGHIFTHAFPKDTSSKNVERYLTLLSTNVDERKAKI